MGGFLPTIGLVLIRLPVKDKIDETQQLQQQSTHTKLCQQHAGDHDIRLGSIVRFEGGGSSISMTPSLLKLQFGLFNMFNITFFLFPGHTSVNLCYLKYISVIRCVVGIHSMFLSMCVCCMNAFFSFFFGFGRVVMNIVIGAIRIIY